MIRLECSLAPLGVADLKMISEFLAAGVSRPVSNPRNVLEEQCFREHSFGRFDSYTGSKTITNVVELEVVDIAPGTRSARPN